MAPRKLSSEEDIVARFAAARAQQPKVKTTKRTEAGPVFRRFTFMLKRLQLAKDSVRRTFADIHSSFKDCDVKRQVLNELDKCQACVHEVEMAIGDTLDDLKEPKVRAALERPDDVKVVKKRKRNREAPPDEESASQASGSQASASQGSGSQASASQDSGLQLQASASQAKAEKRKAQIQEYLDLRKQGKDHYSSWQTAVLNAADHLGVTSNFGCRKGSELYIKAKEFQKHGHF